MPMGEPGAGVFLFRSAMQAFLEALKQPEYVHVLLNHLPLAGLFAALLGLLGALVVRHRPGVRLGLVLVTLFALSAWPVTEFGEEGFDRVLSLADDDGAAYLKHHEELADRWVFLFYVTAGVGALGLAASWKWPKSLVPCAGVVAVLAASSLVAGAVIAEAGGKVRHREFRLGPAPVEPKNHAQKLNPTAARSADAQSARSAT